MAQGIGRQLSLCGLSNSTLVAPPVNASRPAWCSDDELTSGLQAAQTRLWDSIAGSASVLYTEVWTPVFSNGTFTIGDLGAISPTGTEGEYCRTSLHVTLCAEHLLQAMLFSSGPTASLGSSIRGPEDLLQLAFDVDERRTIERAIAAMTDQV